MTVELSPYILNDITQIVTSLGVILTAVSSIMNRLALNRVDKKLGAAVQVAVETKKEAAETAATAVQKIEEAREAAVAVNAEVVKEVHEAGVVLGKELSKNGNHAIMDP